MAATPLDLMRSGGWYSCLLPELDDLRCAARRACHAHATQDPDQRGPFAAELGALFAAVGENVFIEAPFHCSYGLNLHLGDEVYVNAGCTILDSAPVRIGARTMLGPHVTLACADHHRDIKQRARGIERALPVTLGEDVWVGAGVTVLPAVTIGDGAIIAAGAVVTKDVASGSRVAGVPARAL